MSPLLLSNIGIVVAGLPCVLLVAGGLPGAWILLGLAAAIELADPLWMGPDVTSIGWWAIGAGAGVAAVGEVAELLSGSIGARTGGGTRRGMVGSVLGGLLGAVVATFLVPIPLVGTLIGILVGTFTGAWIGETTGAAAVGPKEALRPALAATVGRVVGTVVKVGVALIVWTLVSAAAVQTLLG